jgi:hypothetical protein
VAALCGNLNPYARMARAADGGPVSAGACVASRFWAKLVLDSLGGKTMFQFQDLFQWDRFIAPDCTDTAKRPDFVGLLEGRVLILRGN